MSAVTTVAVPRTRPLVFVGPSASREDVLEFLPDAEIRGPVRRGDLHMARLLRYSAFVVLDGVFAHAEAISPREVVDVVSDGAVFLGGASMGALRAVDCAPAGAIGAGAVWRLFRRGLLNSEDEVGVLFTPERPFPAMTLALVTARVALRRATRQGRMSVAHANRAIDAATQMHYSDRTWPAIFKAAGIEVSPEVRRLLSSVDIKRDDARATLRLAARLMDQDPTWTQRPRQSAGTFGLLGEGRAHETDPALGRSKDAIAPGFLLWMVGSGRASPEIVASGFKLISLAPDLNLKDRLDRLAWSDIGRDIAALKALSDDLLSRLRNDNRLDAERLRYLAVSKAARAQSQVQQNAHAKDVIAVQTALSRAHGLADWKEVGLVCDAAHLPVLRNIRDCWALAKSSRRKKDEEGNTA